MSKPEYRVEIWQDGESESPREWDNLGLMLCFHPRYELGDEHGFANIDDGREYIKSDECVVVLPLFLYDHSGISIASNTEYPFNCPWDSSMIGWLVVTKEKMMFEYGKIDDESVEKAICLLQDEVRTYRMYLTGDIWGFTIEEGVMCESCKRVEWEVVDSCGGFYGSDPKENGMLGNVEERFHTLFINYKEKD
jgi:hypothetical protein